MDKTIVPRAGTSSSLMWWRWGLSLRSWAWFPGSVKILWPKVVNKKVKPDWRSSWPSWTAWMIRCVNFPSHDDFKKTKLLIRSWTMRMEAKSSAGSRAGWATRFEQTDCICKTLKYLPFCSSALVVIIYQLLHTPFFAQVRRVAAGAGVLEKEVQELLKQYAKFAQVTFVQAGL